MVIRLNDKLANLKEVLDFIFEIRGGGDVVEGFDFFVV